MLYSLMLEERDAHIARLHQQIFHTRQRIRAQIRVVKEMRDEGLDIDLGCRLLRLLIQSLITLRRLKAVETANRATVLLLLYKGHAFRAS